MNLNLFSGRSLFAAKAKRKPAVPKADESPPLHYLDLDEPITPQVPVSPVTPASMELAICSEEYHTFSAHFTTVCCLRLKNGDVATGSAICSHPEKFNIVALKMRARHEAFRKLMAFELQHQDRLAGEAQAL